MRYNERVSPSHRRGGNSFTEAKQRYYPQREDERSNDGSRYLQNSYHRHNEEPSRLGSSDRGYTSRDSRRKEIDDYAAEAEGVYDSARLDRGYYSNSEYRRTERESHRHDSRESIIDDYRRYETNHRDSEGRDSNEIEYHSRREASSRRHGGRHHGEEYNSESVYHDSQRSQRTYSVMDSEDRSRTYRNRDKRKKSNTLHQLADLYEDVFSGRSISRSRSSSVSSGSYSSYEEYHNVANCMNTLFNKNSEKNLDLIRCDKVGTSSNEVHLRINLPLPSHLVENFDELVPTKSGLESAVENLKETGGLIAKHCDLNYNDIEDQVVLDEEFPGGVMPEFYKSLFEAPTDGSSVEDEEKQEYMMNPVFVGDHDINNGFEDQPDVQRNVSLPTHIVVDEGASDVSSQASFGDMSFGKHVPKKKGHTEQKVALDTPRSRRSTQRSDHLDHNEDPDWIPAKREQLDLVDQRYPSFDAPQDESLKKETTKAHKRYPTMIDGIPVAIDYDSSSHVRDLPATCSDLTGEEGLASDEYAVVRNLSLSNESNKNEEDPGHIPYRPASNARLSDISGAKNPRTKNGDELMSRDDSIGAPVMRDSELRMRARNTGIKASKKESTEDEIMIPNIRESRFERSRDTVESSWDKPVSTRSSRSIALRRERLRNSSLKEELTGRALHELGEDEIMGSKRDELMTTKLRKDKDDIMSSRKEEGNDRNIGSRFEHDELMGKLKDEEDEIMTEKFVLPPADMQPEDELIGTKSHKQSSQNKDVTLDEFMDKEDELMGKALHSSSSKKPTTSSEGSTAEDAPSGSTKIVANTSDLHASGMVDPATLKILQESDDIVSRLMKAAAARIDALDGNAMEDRISSINETTEGKEENKVSEELPTDLTAELASLKADQGNSPENSANDSMGVMLSSYTVESFARYCKKLAEWDEDDGPEDDVDEAGKEMGGEEASPGAEDEVTEAETRQTMDQEENKVTLLSEIDARSQAVEINYLGYKSTERHQAPSSVSVVARPLEISPTLTFAHTSITEETPVNAPSFGGHNGSGSQFGSGLKKSGKTKSNFYTSHDEFEEDEYQFDERYAKLSSLLPAAARTKKNTGTLAVTQIFVVEFWTKGLATIFVFVVTWFHHLISLQSKKNLTSSKAGGPNFRALAVNGDIQPTTSRRIQGSSSYAYNHTFETETDDGMSVSYVVPEVHDAETGYSQKWKVTPSLGRGLRPKAGSQTYSNIRQTFSRSDARSVASMREWSARNDDQAMEFCEE